MNIKIIDNLLSKEEALALVAEYCEEENLGNKEILKKDIEENSTLDILLNDLKFYFNEYKNNIDLKREIFYDKVVAIKNANTEGQEHPMHFDQSSSLYPSDIGISVFVSLIYLSDDFDGGQLYFPFQKQIIEPKIGRMIMFPCNVLYSHKILPFKGNPRYLFRIFHLFNSELNEKDKFNLINRLNLKQEKKEL